MKKNNNKLNIFLAASPVQLICINELRSKNLKDEFLLILFLRNKTSDFANRQMELTLERLGFKNN